MKTCIVIPVYNHEGAMGQVLASLKGFKLPCIMVNDGSDAPCREALLGLAQKNGSWVSLIHLEQNQGKGAAVMAGLKSAAERGFSHAIQIDADGQHNASDLPRFLEESKKNPGAIICGLPIFDDTIPMSRLYGRFLTNIWIWINTLSFQIKDAMCGFRLYPLAPVLALMEKVALGLRMDFDPELLVRLSWKGHRIVSVPTQVHYPSDGRSHFLLFWDNWLISRMHARLFFGMLARFPLLLWNKWQLPKQDPGARPRNSAPPGG